MLCSYSIERQGLGFYTREVFDRFQKMVIASTRFHPLQAEGEGISFDLVPNPNLDLKTYRVQVAVEEGLYSCGCNAFEMCGLICPHIIRVMVHLNVQQIPTRYMLDRWAAAATTPTPDPGANTIRFGVPPTNTLKYNSLCRKMNDLASDACYNDETYVVVSRMVDEARKLVAAMRRAQHDEQQVEENGLPPQQAEKQYAETQQQAEAQDVAPSSTLKKPPRTKPKGRPKEKEKRRKPLLELRDEANKRRRKKQSEPKKPKERKPKRAVRPMKCPYCNEEGHTVQECK